MSRWVPGLVVILFASPSATAAQVSPQRALVDRYCVTCHSARLGTAGLVLEGLPLENVARDAATWEKVTRKLRTGTMPPAGAPRPDPAALQQLVTSLEADLDRAAAARPNPAPTPAFHRLNRTEYQNAVRDLLALDHLPKEMDIELLLPPDDTTDGFDNMADSLFVSPVLLERYLSAAEKISRLAVGDPAMPLMIDTYRLHAELSQDGHFDDLPIGTRGGTLIQRYFPLDGEYAFGIDLGRGGASGETHDLELSVDGQRVQLFTIGGAERRAPAGALQVRLPVKAGSRSIGVTFIQKSAAPDESLVKPFVRNRGQDPGVSMVTITGPYAGVGAEGTSSWQRIFACSPGRDDAEEQACARRILTTLVRRAYRRPAAPSDVDRLMPFYQAGAADGGFERGVQRALERVLISPQFLFRIERQPAAVAPGVAYRLGDVELASRLSFFLWSSIPDDELLSLASRGQLGEPRALEQQVRRMLADPRAERFVTTFGGQWLNLRDFAKAIPDERLFPDYDDRLRQDLRRETELFLLSLVREDRSVLDVLRADHTFVNERLAAHYGIPNVAGSHFRRVVLGPHSPRHGLLGQGSLLTVTSYATRTSPVLRGKWILDNLLGTPPPPPPPDVPSLRDTNADGKVLSMRERMVQHRVNPVCSSCHALMDPLGLSLESFDAVGRWRVRGESNAPLDVSGTLPDGTKFEGVDGLRGVLLGRPEQFITTLTEKLLVYALGRRHEASDAPAIRRILRDASGRDYTFSSILVGIVTSEPFLMRRSR